MNNFDFDDLAFIASMSSGSAVVTYSSSASSTADLTTYTFAGSAVSGKNFVGVCSRRSGVTLSVASMTIGGVSATEVITKQFTLAGVVGFTSIWVATSPSAGDIVVTLSDPAVRCAIVVWSAENISSTPYSTANYGAATSASINLNLNTLDGYAVIALVSGTPSTTITWTGVTENADFTVETTMYVSAGSVNSVTAATPRTVTAAPAGGSAPQRYGVAVCLPPE